MPARNMASDLLEYGYVSMRSGYRPALLPATDRYAALLGAYAWPGESLLDAAPRMTPGDLAEAGLLAEALEPYRGPRLAAARGA
jgi:hypothetical protein